MDMWSVGCILAEMIMGAPIFRGDSAVHQIDAICAMVGKPSEEYIATLPSYFVRTMRTFPWIPQVLRCARQVAAFPPASIDRHRTTFAGCQTPHARISRPSSPVAIRLVGGMGYAQLK
jgi:hypothetical protein